MFTESNLLAQIIFGAIGMGAFIYGKNQGRAGALLIGIALSVYPFFVTETWIVYAVGIGLTLCLFMGSKE